MRTSKENPVTLHVFDFDGTLFRSPHPPDGWAKDWWGNPVSLNPPAVPEKPGLDWWNTNVIERAKQALGGYNTFVVLVTARSDGYFHTRVHDLLKQQGLDFNRVYLSPGGPSEAYKIRVMSDLLAEFPSIRGVSIWEDREDHLKTFADWVESGGRACFPHLITVSPHPIMVGKTSSRPIQIDKPLLRGVTSNLVQYILGRVAVEAPSDAAKKYRTIKTWGGTGLEFGPLVVDIKNVQGKPKSLNVFLRTSKGGGKPGRNSFVAGGSYVTSGVDEWVEVRLYPSITGKQILDNVSRLEQEIYSTLIHEVTHASEVSQEETTGLDPGAYYNTPSEVRAYLQQVADEVVANGLPTDTGKGLQDALRASPTWDRIHKYLTPGNERLIIRGVSTHVADQLEQTLAHRVAAKYQKKKTVKTKDGDDMTVYEYSDRQVANRNRDKAERIEGLRGHISDLRARVKKDLKCKDGHKKLVALAVALMDHTCERVGNHDSAEDGHFGVTGWLTKHVKVKGDKATVTYVGKSGVDHEKVIDDPSTLSALKEALKGKKDTDRVLENADSGVDPEDVNEYLKEFDITAKDIRGFRANDEMCKALTEQRSKGPKELPRDRKEKDKILKGEFKKALEAVAEIVGHEPTTLRSQYLVPGVEEQYVHDGTVLKDLTSRKGKSATKTHSEKEDEAAEDLIRPPPKKKPPRNDLRSRRVDDIDSTDSNDKVASCKRVAAVFSLSHTVNGTVVYPPGNKSGFNRGGETLMEDSMTIKKASIYGARRVTATLDRVATLLQTQHQALGVPTKIAMDMALRCDMLSDHIQGQYGVKNAGFFNPAEIAEEVPGPLVNDSTQPFMKGHYTNEKFVQLGEKQESGELASHAEKHVADPKLASQVQRIAKEAAEKAVRDFLARRAEEEEKAEEAAKEEPKKEAKAEEKVEETVEEKVEETPEEDAKKAASDFGLFINS